MKELFEKILQYLPRYFLDFGEVFSGPKSFIGQRNLASAEAFPDALLFFGISIVLLIALQLPVQPADQEFWKFAGSVGVLQLIAVTLSAMFTRIAWWLVGGRASGQSFFITYSYFGGVVIVLIGAIQLLAFGVVKIFDRKFFQQLVDAPKMDAVVPQTDEQAVLYLVFGGIVVVGFVLVSAWFFIGWGAFRQLNALSKWRSFAAAVIYGFVSIPATAAVVFIAAAMGR
jgi:hypothetical protein